MRKIYKIKGVVSSSQQFTYEIAEYEIVDETDHSYTVLVPQEHGNPVRHVWPKKSLRKIKSDNMNVVTKNGGTISFRTKCLDNELDITKDVIRAHITDCVESLYNNAINIYKNMKGDRL